MRRTTRGWLLVVLCLIAVASLVLTGCGSKKEAALKQPGLELTSYNKGSTVDFDDTTLNSMADGGGEAAFKYNVMKAAYPTIWNSNKDAVAQALFPAPYWRGDGVHTYYSYLISADQTAVDGTIFATKLSAAEQTVVTNAIEGFFGLYNDEVAAAKPVAQNTAATILASSGLSAATWATEATAWMTALNAYAAANYGGKTYAQLTYIERKTVEGIVFANGAGTINPEYSFWRTMVKDSFRNGTASATYPDVAEERATTLKGKSYSALDCVEKPQVDGAVWAALTSAQQANVTERVAGIFTLATEQVNGVTSDNQNIYYYTLSGALGLTDNLTTDNSTAQASADWLDAVDGTTPGTSENTSFYAEILGGQSTWKSMLTYKYFGTDNYSALSTASKAVIDQSDLGTFALSVAQRSPAMPLTSNILYQTLAGSVSATAATGWATDVGAGMNRELAFYKWLAYEGFRNGIIAAQQYYPTQLAAKMPAGKTWSTLSACEQRTVAADMWASLGAGEQTYGAGVVSGIFGKAQAEMTDAVALNQTALSMALRATGGAAYSSETAATNFKANVESGMSVRQAFYRWLAKENVKQMASSAVLIQMSVGEFYFKVTNPNKYEITIDEVVFHFQTTAGASSEVIDGARAILQTICVPAEGEIILKVLAPTKAYDLISWLVMDGKDSNTARAMASEVFSKIQDTTNPMTAEDWTYTADAQVSNADETQEYSYSG
jgi:hypothetical protein